MRARTTVLAILLASLWALAQVATQRTRAQPNGADGQQSAITHGQYVVHHVAMCIHCHSPRNNQGVLDRDQLLEGAPIPLESPFAGQRWAFQAPKLAGLPGGYTEEELIRFLQTGETVSGRTPLPPMPPFRMTERDAMAVAAYLKSLR
jgi:mono/diheme cytochrome c family protein